MELQKDMKIKDKTWLLKIYKGLTPSGALEIAKQRFISALVTRLRRHIKEAEAKKIHGRREYVPSQRSLNQEIAQPQARWEGKEVQGATPYILLEQ